MASEATDIADTAVPKGLDSFFLEYHGHTLPHLRYALRELRGQQNRPCVFLAGDSSLDNKFWFKNWAEAVNGYESFLPKPKMKQDVSYWLNKEASQSGSEWFALNCAVEESALRDRSGGRLLPQDEFIRDNITENDMLIVSVGGNDIALKPSMATIKNMLTLTYLSTEAWVKYARACECNKWTCSTCMTRPPGLSYFVRMFSTLVKNYIERLIARRKPKRVIVCMIYFPLEDNSHPCWADQALDALKYNTTPTKLQSIIRTVYHLGTKQIRIAGTEVVPFPLFETLDGKHIQDYVARVEPSPKGGEKMAKALAEAVIQPTAEFPST